MSFIASFTVESLIAPGSFIINDTSAGSDPNLTGRTISLFKADNTLLTGATIDFPLSSGSSIMLTDILDVDYCLYISIEWASSSPLPAPSVYTAADLYNFIGNSRDYEDFLIGVLSSNPSQRDSKNFYDNLSKLQTEIDNSIQAASTGQQVSAQAALTRALALIQNQTLFY